MSKPIAIEFSLDELEILHSALTAYNKRRFDGSIDAWCDDDTRREDAELHREFSSADLLDRIADARS